jgi:hypothetical protein
MGANDSLPTVSASMPGLLRTQIIRHVAELSDHHGIAEIARGKSAGGERLTRTSPANCH